MKQTAVERLEEQLDSFLDLHFSDWMILNKFIDQAKEIEKQQIKDAYITGMFNAHSKTSIDYYKETYETTL